MQIQCPRKDFFDAVQLVGHAITGRSTHEMLKHILITTGNDMITLTGGDRDVWIERTIPAIVGSSGSATIPAKMITELVGGFGEGDLTMELDGTMVRMQTGHSSYNMMGYNAADYPDLPRLENPTRFEIPGELLRDMIKQVGFAVSSDEARPVLTGTLVNTDGATLRMVATDTHRLAVREAQISASGAEVNAVVPERAVNLLPRLPLGESGTITVAFEPKLALFEVAGIRMVTQLIADGQFPNYQRVIPTSTSRTWKLIRQEFSQAVTRAGVVARENADRVIAQTEGEKLVLSARSEIAEAREEIDVARDGGDLEVAFNFRYLLDFMNSIDTEELTIELTESQRPALLKPVSETNEYQCVIMPMNLS